MSGPSRTPAFTRFRAAVRTSASRTHVVPVLAAFTLVALAAVPAGCSDVIPYDQLVADAERLAWIIEDAHPAPYERGGGEEAFRARRDELLAGIPAEGMSAAEFQRLAMPFVASVGDAHTRLDSNESIDWHHPGGVPLVFAVIEEGLAVGAVTSEEHRELLGARLIDVEGVPVDELARRTDQLRASENVYARLMNLGETGTLFRGDELARILPEWDDRSAITVTLLTVDDEPRELTFDRPHRFEYPLIQFASEVELPAVDRCDFAWKFMDEAGEVALLRVVGMMQYREALEMWENMGVERRRETGRAAYERFHGSAPPADYAEVIAGVPSATETFRELVVAMQEAGTRTLLVDLRENDGGNSYMSNVLVYFLYGSDTLLNLPPTLITKKYSAYYFDHYPNETIESINEGRAVPLAVGECDTLQDPRRGVTAEIIEKRMEDLRLMDTFIAEFESHEYDGYYLPERVIVLVSPHTFSAGYTMMRYLYWSGAELAGTPSGQAGNCFGDILHFALPNTGLTGTVSHKRYADFPDDPELGRVIPMDHPMTYERLREWAFDGNAEVWLGMEVGREG